MVIQIEGKVRRRTRMGRGIFRVERWHESPFRVVISPEAIESGEKFDAGDHLNIRCESRLGRIFFHAEVNRRPFVLGEAVCDKPKIFQFSILSVAGYEITGRVTCKLSA